ncbi:hypothetical protein OG806_21390 [Streptomyces sp. NBC_00882]|uniref:LmrA/YxaF family transcription factor n=1 Tax=Streptomyces sp. NBC_00882 TaxID=2975856 RepID=UPI00386E277A|nr:hypothetical protein OG806_21390 [Streptomyces sp. NBC_00882]
MSVLSVQLCRQWLSAGAASSWEAVQEASRCRQMDPAEAAWRLKESGFRAGCPIVAVAVQTNNDAPPLARSATAGFARRQEVSSPRSKAR